VNLPNKITVSRFLASVILFILLIIMDFMGDTGWMFPLVSMVLFILVVSTDALDGYYARKYNLVTDFGRIADPVVDKIMICGSLILLTVTSWGRVLLPAWLVVLVVAREFLVNGIRGYIESRGIRFGSNWAGKGKLISQAHAIPAVLLYQTIHKAFPSIGWAVTSTYYLALVIIWIMLVLTLYSGFLYVSKAAEILKKEPE